MSKVVFSLLVFVSISFYSLAQDFASECIPVTGSASWAEIAMNSLGEMVWREESRLIRLDKAGKVLWEFPAESGFDFKDFTIDNAGNVYAMAATDGSWNPTAFRFYKLTNANGALAWTPKNIAAPKYLSSLKVDAQGNIYIAGAQFNGVDAYGVYVEKYNSAGAQQWLKLFPDIFETTTYYAGPKMVLTAQGQPIISAHTGIWAFTNTVIKLDVNGNQLWRSDPIESYYSGNSIYADNSGNAISLLSDEYSGSSVYKLSTSTGAVLSNTDVELGATALVFNGTQIILGGSYSDPNRASYGIMTLNADLSTATFASYEYSLFMIGGSVTSMVVDGSDLFVSGSIWGPEGFSFIRKHVSVTAAFGWAVDWTYEMSAGSISLSPEKYIFTGGSKCLTKIIPCELATISYSKQPASVQTCAGADVSFTAEAVGTGLSYYWRKDGQQLSNSTKYAGVNTTTLTVKGTGANDVGNYTCVVKDGCGKTLNSQPAALSLKASPIISAQPQNVSQCGGTDVTFQITTTGGTNVKYQWKKGNTALSESALIVGTKTNKLTLKTISPADGGEYFCEVTADCYSVAIPSQKGSLNVMMSTVITKEPVSVSSCAGKTAVFSVEATGSSLTYQWKKGATNLADGAAISGSKTSVLTLSSVKDSDAGDYTCVVSASCGSNVSSAIGKLSVADEEKITAQPQSKVVCSGQSVSFAITTSAAAASYQWRKGNTILTNTGKYSGVNTATLNVANVTATEEGAYSCTIATSCATEVISNSAQLSLGTSAVISSRSADLKLCERDVAKFSITTTGQPASYQWKKGGVVINDSDKISGTKRAELHLAGLTETDAGNFTCEITSACGAKQESGVIKLEINKAVMITTQPLTQNVCEYTDVTLNVIAIGHLPTYQWKKGGVNLTDGASISGSKSAVLMIKDFTIANEGAYTCFVSGCDGVTASETVMLTGNANPDLILVDGIDCSNVQPSWSSLVRDLANTNGEYMLFADGSTDPIDILEITKTGRYYIVKQAGACADTIAWQNDCLITGFEESSAQPFSISPNPSTGQVKLIDHQQRIESYEAYDIYGRRVATGRLGGNNREHIIEMNSFSNGVYLIVFRDHTGAKRSARIIIQH